MCGGGGGSFQFIYIQEQQQKNRRHIITQQTHNYSTKSKIHTRYSKKIKTHTVTKQRGKHMLLQRVPVKEENCSRIRANGALKYFTEFDN